MKRRGLLVVLGCSVSCAGLCLGVPLTSGTDVESLPTDIPVERLQEVRKSISDRNWTLPAEVVEHQISRDEGARITAAMGLYLVECDVPSTLSALDVRRLTSQQRSHWIVPTPEGARPIANVGSGSLDVMGAFVWSGATTDRPGTCSIEAGAVDVTGRLTHQGRGQMTAVEICGVPFLTNNDGSFEGKLPANAHCDVNAYGWTTTRPAQVRVDGSAPLEIEVVVPEETPALLPLLAKLWNGPDVSQPGDFERALAAEGLSPETREVIEYQAARERVAREIVSREFSGWNLVKTMVVGPSIDLPEDLLGMNGEP